MRVARTGGRGKSEGHQQTCAEQRIDERCCASVARVFALSPDGDWNVQELETRMRVACFMWMVRCSGFESADAVVRGQRKIFASHDEVSVFCIQQKCNEDMLRI